MQLLLFNTEHRN